MNIRSILLMAASLIISTLDGQGAPSKTMASITLAGVISHPVSDSVRIDGRFAKLNEKGEFTVDFEGGRKGFY